MIVVLNWLFSRSLKRFVARIRCVIIGWRWIFSVVVVTVFSVWLILLFFSLLFNGLIGSCFRFWMGRLISFFCVIRFFVFLSWLFLKSIVG